MSNFEPAKASVLVVDDIPANRKLLRDTLEPAGYEILLAPDGETALTVCQRTRPDVILLDIMMPGMDGFETCRRLKQREETRAIPVIFITARDETEATVEGFRAGGVDYINKPFQTEEVLARLRTHLENSRLTRALIRKNEELAVANQRLSVEVARREEAETSLSTMDRQLSLITEIEAERWGIPALIGTSPTLRRIIETVRKLQPLPSTRVLITGESGTGKELIARALHFGGPRAKAPFLPVNCSAIPADLAESLFFGHVKGVFSGATTDKKGYFENAEGGTLFLDEIGDMPLPLQAKLLRVLEENRVLPLGAAREVTVNVRVMAATNAELPAEIAAGKFRADLYHRLAQFVVEAPPLRDRREDIPSLAQHFLRHFAREMGLAKPSLSSGALSLLDGCDFPGNIRELKNLIERALIESGGGEILPDHLYFMLPPKTGTAPSEIALASPGEPQALASGASLPPGEEDRILEYVREHGMINNTQCRELLGVGIHRAWYLLRKLQRRGALQQDSSRRWTQYRLT